jgi:ATP-binding cassette subfamily B protein
MRRYLVPECIQTSAMDCGPASLKSLLEGFGVRASYGRLREACFTGVDGTSIDQIEDAAVRLGLDAEQVMLPVDHLLLDEAAALPALVVVRLASGATHFVIVWRRCGAWIQIMDPGVGRQWRAYREFLSELYVHNQPVPADSWRQWAGSPDFLKPFAARLAKLGIVRELTRELISQAVVDPGVDSLAALDAAVRLVESLAIEGAVRRGPEIAELVKNLVKRPEAIPQAWWSVRLNMADRGQAVIRGAVLMRVKGLRSDRVAEAPEPAAGAEREASFTDVLTETPRSPLSELWRAWRADGLRFPLALVAALVLAAAGVAAEAVLFRGMFDLARVLALGFQRWVAFGALLAFMGAITLLELSVTGSIVRIGRKFEGLLRLDFLTKIPRLPDAYFRSRLMSDMAERAHSAHLLRDLPTLVAALARAVFGLAATVAGIAWLYPYSRTPALAGAVMAVLIPLLAQPWLAERDLRARSHSGALGRFFLDALLGLTALHAHGAGRAIVREHENLLGEWAGAALRSGRASVAVQGFQAVACLATVAWLLFAQMGHGGQTGGLLLLVYWALNIPALGQEVATLACQYPRLRNTLLRFTELLGAREEGPAEAETQTEGFLNKGVAVEMDAVAVRMAGHSILEEVTLRLEPGEHVAVVGTSGAGKSSLAGLLLGWYRPAAGEVRIDGKPLTAASQARLRAETLWLAPQVHLWNRSLFENLEYGNATRSTEATSPGIDAVLEEAELSGVVEKLPLGMQTRLGESGRLLSGGEGQRVRFGRGLRRSGIRLAILDEAFRGLERGRRRTLLETAKRRWKDATLLHITHDVGETWSFQRVLVVDRGRVIEDGAPRDLYQRADSRYRALVDAEESVRESVWADPRWRKLVMEDGRLREEAGAVESGAARERVTC